MQISVSYQTLVSDPGGCFISNTCSGNVYQTEGITIRLPLDKNTVNQKVAQSFKVDLILIFNWVAALGVEINPNILIISSYS